MRPQKIKRGRGVSPYLSVLELPSDGSCPAPQSSPACKQQTGHNRSWQPLYHLIKHPPKRSPSLQVGIKSCLPFMIMSVGYTWNHVYKILDITFPLQKMRTKVPKYRDTTFQRLLIERMQQLRSDHGYSQEEVIEFTHLDISRYESGTSIPNTQSILKLCKLYNITIAEFFAPINYPAKKE